MWSKDLRAPPETKRTTVRYSVPHFRVHCRAMRSNEQQDLPRREAIVFLFVATVMVALLQGLFYQMPKPALDALRYIDYALNIHDHAVFGLSGTRRDAIPAPGYASSPMYPALVAVAASLDTGLEASLRCAVTDKHLAGAECPGQFGVLVVIQNGLIIIGLFCLWATARLLFRRSLVAWLACALALASTKPLFFANNLVTEILVLALFPLLMLGLVLASKRGCRWWPITGIVLGLMTLTRPEYLYLAYAFALVGVCMWVWGRRRQTGTALLLSLLAFFAVVGPWMARNNHHFGHFAVTGGYGDVIFAYRSAYNRMSVAEWAAAFVYWLPGHGETLAAKMLPQTSYAKLGTDPASYLYTDGSEVFERGLAAVNGDRDRLFAYLIRTEVLAHPVKHALVSVPLAWRGILAGKYLAVPGVPCLAILLIVAARRGEWRFPALVLPAMIMVALYAAVSVSIPRYNVYLIYYYAIATAWAMVSLLERRRFGL